MLKSIIITVALISGGLLLSLFNVGYSTAGENYISKHRDERKSVRPGYYYGHTGYGGIRGGK